MIKINIEMPKCCKECFALSMEEIYCNITGQLGDYNFNPYEYRMPSCPLEEVEEENNPCDKCQEWDCDGCNIKEIKYGK